MRKITVIPKATTVALNGTRLRETRARKPANGISPSRPCDQSTRAAVSCSMVQVARSASIINFVGVRAAATMNNIGVLAEIVGAVIIIVALLVVHHHTQPLSILTDTAHSSCPLERLSIPNHSATNGTMLQETAATETVWAMTIHQPDCQLTGWQIRRTKRDLVDAAGERVRRHQFGHCQAHGEHLQR